MTLFDLSGRVALVTGASRGIGLTIAERLVDAGATVIINARHIDDDVTAALEARRAGSVLAIKGAIDQPDFAKAMLKDVFARFKRLDILVNNAGIMRSGMIGMISDADINETLAVNLGGVIHVTQAAARLIGRTGGSIINISSIIGVRGFSGQFVYAASKAGVIGATLSAAKELAAKGVRVNAIAPGFIETKMTEDMGEAVKAQTLTKIGMGRLGTPANIADVTLFLASDLSRYVTGQVIGVDGGLVL